jgi:GTP cyclohydrolase I
MILSGQNMNLSCTEKEAHKALVEKAYGEFLTSLGYDWENDPNMKGTPKRVAKMYLNEVTKGSYDPSPVITSFDNRGGYDGIVFQGNITIKSLCSHHMQPFIGKCHVAYIPDPKGKVIGLSKLNRICDYFARRPQLQEQLTLQIHKFIDEVTIKNKGVAVLIEAQHLCVQLRGIEHDSIMKTSKLSGNFFDNSIGTREEFYRMVADLKR